MGEAKRVMEMGSGARVPRPGQPQQIQDVGPPVAYRDGDPGERGRDGVHEVRGGGEVTELPDKHLLRVDEVAQYLDVSPATIYRMKDEGDLEAKKIRGSIRITRTSVLTFLENQ